jgi:hydroxyacylglutathione hydrolase
VRVERRAVDPFFKNGFVVSCEDTREGVIIDPGDEVTDLVDVARSSGVAIQAILLTHAHLDHITGVGRARQAFDVPIWLHPEDLFLYDGIVEQGELFGLDLVAQPPVDRFYAPNQQLAFGRYVVDVLHTPGHCPGGVCLAIGRRGHADRELFVGDTLFAGTIGRTDLPGGSLPRLLASIHDVLLQFPDETVVHPGHGPDTTIGLERATNTFLN